MLNEAEKLTSEQRVPRGKRKAAAWVFATLAAKDSELLEDAFEALGKPHRYIC